MPWNDERAVAVIAQALQYDLDEKVDAVLVDLRAAGEPDEVVGAVQHDDLVAGIDCRRAKQLMEEGANLHAAAFLHDDKGRVHPPACKNLSLIRALELRTREIACTRRASSSASSSAEQYTSVAFGAFRSSSVAPIPHTDAPALRQGPLERQA